jgi:hypothetical protein
MTGQYFSTVGLLVHAWAAARACLQGPPASGLHPTMMARLKETPITIGSAQEASGRLSDGGASSNLGGNGEKMEGGRWGRLFIGERVWARSWQRPVSTPQPNHGFDQEFATD